MHVDFICLRIKHDEGKVAYFKAVRLSRKVLKKEHEYYLDWLHVEDREYL